VPWLRIDDHMVEHPKLVEVGGDAGWLHLCAMSWSARHGTDGFVPDGIVLRVSDRRQPAKLAVALERARLWERVEGGFQIHDWAEYQPSAYETKSRRESVSKVRSAASALAHHRRWHEARGVRSDECPHCEPDAKSMPNRCQIDAPVPVPVPITSSLSTTTTARESAASSSSSSSIDDPRFGETVDLAVEIAALAAGEVRSPGPWRAAVRRTIVAEHGPQIVAHLAARPGATAGETVRVVLGRSELDVARARQARSVG
jgi:hypothetical protein